MRRAWPYLLMLMAAVIAGCLAMALGGDGVIYEIGAWLTIVSLFALAITYLAARYGPWGAAANDDDTGEP